MPNDVIVEEEEVEEPLMDCKVVNPSGMTTDIEGH